MSSYSARWLEAEGLVARQVCDGRIHYLQTKSSKNRSIPVTQALQKQIREALPFGGCYKKFGEAVEAVNL
jgi:hypothetical protein